MMKKTALIFSLLLLALPVVASEERVAGPDGRLVVTVSDAGGKPTYSVAYDGTAFVAPSPLGLKADIGDFTAGLTLTGFAQEAVADDYSVPTIKASTVHYRANKGVFTFAKDGKPVIDVIFQVSANDIAFRYQIYAPKPDTKVCVIQEEATGYVFPDGTTSFLSPMMGPMSGFARTTPSYETDYRADEPLGKNGDLFANNNVVPVEVTALTDCVVWHINREAFFEFMQQEPTVLRAFLEILSERGRFLSRKMRTFAVNSLRNRVIEYLEANGSITSVAAAAEQLGATRPSLSRVLSEMVSEGLITKDGKGYKKC